MKAIALAAALVLAHEPSPLPLAFASLSFERAEQAAVAHSPEVAGAQAVVDEDVAALAAARGYYGPSLVGGYNLAPQGGSNDTTISSRLTSVGVQTTIGDLVAYAPLVAAATETLRAARANAEVARRTERIKLAGLYYGALRARAIRAARESALALAIAQRDAADLRLRAGDAPRLDVVRAQVAVARATADVENARAADRNATEELRIETATPAALVRTAAGAEPAPWAPSLTPAKAVARAEALRPELRAAAAAVAAARATKSAAVLGALPAVTLGAGYARGQDSGVEVAGPTINVSVNIPLSGVARDRAAQQAAVVRQNQAFLRSQQRAIDVEVGAAARNVAAAEKATAASDQAREQAAEQLRATELGYKNGASSSLELSLARDTYAQASVDDLSARYDRARAQAILAIEVGE